MTNRSDNNRNSIGKVHTPMRLLAILSVAFAVALSASVESSYAGKAQRGCEHEVFATQVLCDNGSGPQYAGRARLNNQGDFIATLTGLPPDTPVSCVLDCDLTGLAIDLADCGVTDQHGNLFVRYQQLADDFGGACVGLRVSVYSIAGGFSCA